MRTTSQLRAVHAPPCGGDNVTLDFGDQGARVHVRRYAVDAVRALEAIFARHGYPVRKRDTGGYNCRRITGGTGYSLHAYGISVDVNWQTNPYTKGGLITDMPAAMIAEVRALKTRGGHRVWRWGGDYRTVKDAMHFEVVASPAELATGIAYDLPAAARVSATPPAQPSGDRTLRLGVKGEDVRKLQTQLNEVMGAKLVVDGAFGPATLKAVTDAQRDLAVTVDGLWGKRSWAALRDRRKAAKAAPPFPGRIIELTRPYTRGSDVKTWQAQMRKRGWTVDVDGVFGPASAAVLRAFQAEKGLTADGILGPASWAAAWAATVTP